jgi:serine/threonine-protein kinase
MTSSETTGQRSSTGDRAASRPAALRSRRIARRLPRLLAHLAVMALGAAAALLAFQLWFMPLAVGHGKDIRVPRVVGLAYERAEETLADAGLSARRSTERISPDFRAGVVLDQDPRAGFSTREGRVVGLVVSLGRGEVDIPDVTGESFRHAEIILTREGIAIGHVSRTYADAPIDEVLRVSPVPGTTVVTGRPVNVLLSAGPAPEAYTMPDFRGADPDQVARALRRLGYVVDVSYPVGALSLRGRVLSHTPPPGHRLETGDEIRILAGEL